MQSRPRTARVHSLPARVAAPRRPGTRATRSTPRPPGPPKGVDGGPSLVLLLLRGVLGLALLPDRLQPRSAHASESSFCSHVMPVLTLSRTASAACTNSSVRISSNCSSLNVPLTSIRMFQGSLPKKAPPPLLRKSSVQYGDVARPQATTLMSACEGGAKWSALNIWWKAADPRVRAPRARWILPSGSCVSRTRSPKGSLKLTGSPPANPYRFSPPASPMGSSCVNRPVCGS